MEGWGQGVRGHQLPLLIARSTSLALHFLASVSSPRLGGAAEPPEHMAGASAEGAAAFDLIERNKQRGTSGDGPLAQLATFSRERATPGRWEDDW